MQAARRTSLLISVAFLGLLLWCFGGVLSGASVLAYRDTAHFYFPLYQWLANVWGQGEIPLWNPLENLGMPVASEATAAVFYPGKLVFALPCSFALRFHLYVVLHVVLAGMSMYWLARSWRLRPSSAGLAAISYAFSGTVLFQYCNVVFLVGAAWMPLSFLAAERMLRQRQPRWAIVFGATLALMTLGGDPQSSYHAAFLAVLYAVLIALRRRKRHRSRRGQPFLRRWASSSPALLLLAAVSGSLLAAVQIVPSLGWTAASGRSAFAHPTSLYEIPSYLQRGDPDATAINAVAGLVQSGSPGSHAQQVYEFSIGPWRWPELVWPNVSGTSFPQNRRWLSTAVPAEGRIWSPSLYMGLLPIVLGFGAWRIRKAPLRIRWISWSVVWSLSASLGAYGVIWLLGEFRPLTGYAPQEAGVSGAVGGVYWFMVVALPAYAYFRFPAKLMVVTTLGLSLLAGVGLERWQKRANRPGRREKPHDLDFSTTLTRWLWLISVASAAAAVMISVSGRWWPQYLADAASDELYGPLDVRGAWSDALTACCHAAVLSAVLAIGIARLLRWQHGGVCLVLITTVDIAVANGGLVLTAPTSAVHTASVLAEASRSGEGPVRFYRHPTRLWVPKNWKSNRSEDRATATLAWDRETLYPRFGLLEQLGSVRTVGTMIPYEYSRLWQHSFDGSGGLPSPLVLHALATDYVLAPYGSVDATNRDLSTVSRYPGKNLEVWRRNRPAERAWIVHDVVSVPKLRRADARDPTAQSMRTLEVLRPAGRVRNLRQSAVVELPEGESLQWWHPARRPSKKRTEVDHLTLREYSRRRVVFEAGLCDEGLLVVSDQFWKGWRAVVRTAGSQPREVPIVKTNRVMRGVYLPGGECTIVFEYRPYRHYVAMGASALAWLAMLVYLARHVAGISWTSPALPGKRDLHAGI